MVANSLRHAARKRRRLATSLGAFLLTACASAPPFDASAVVQEWMNYMNRSYELQPGDTISISIYQEPELVQEVTVSPKGTIHLKRLPKEIRAVGKPIQQVRQEIQEAYQEFALVTAEVSVNLVRGSANSVYIAGEVRRPGPIPYVSGMLLSQAISSVGGLAITAKWNDVRVLRNTITKPRTIRVNMEDILFSDHPDFLVLPGDVVFCQTSAVADAGNWIELYIRRMIPIPITTAAVGVDW